MDHGAIQNAGFRRRWGRFFAKVPPGRDREDGAGAAGLEADDESELRGLDARRVDAEAWRMAVSGAAQGHLGYASGPAAARESGIPQAPRRGLGAQSGRARWTTPHAEEGCGARPSCPCTGEPSSWPSTHGTSLPSAAAPRPAAACLPGHAPPRRAGRARPRRARRPLVAPHRCPRARAGRPPDEAADGPIAEAALAEPTDGDRGLPRGFTLHGAGGRAKPRGQTGRSRRYSTTSTSSPSDAGSWACSCRASRTLSI